MGWSCKPHWIEQKWWFIFYSVTLFLIIIIQTLARNIHSDEHKKLLLMKCVKCVINVSFWETKNFFKFYGKVVVCLFLGDHITCSDVSGGVKEICKWTLWEDADTYLNADY